jgi:glycosyltransferase involved in cell wall biosynthesis
MIKVMSVSKFPKISIVTPSFNQAPFLEATIKSILIQEYPNLEYIIIDGGSTDGSIDIIKKYEKHLAFWCSEPDNGQYDAINKGFCHSTREIMAWLNSDDMYLPWALKTVADIMSSFPNIEWLTTLSPGHWDYDGFCSGFGSTPGYALEAFLEGGYLPRNNYEAIAWIQQESTFWRRGLWERTGGCLSTNIKLASDFDLWCRFYTKTDFLYGTSSPLGGFRHQLYQKSRNIEEYIEEAEASLLTMRHSLQWKPNLFKDIFLTGLKKIPKVRKFLVSQWGYKCKKLIRENSDHPDGYWEIKDYKF